MFCPGIQKVAQNPNGDFLSHLVTLGVISHFLMSLGEIFEASQTTSTRISAPRSFTVGNYMNIFI
jgi:hypothetical protein